MRIIKVRLRGIKRFEDETTLHLADRLVAIVGPNESGKTSILRALVEALGIGALPELLRTRQSDVARRIETLFQLSDEDRAALADVRGGSDIQRAWLTRGHSGQSSWSFEPEPARDLGPRALALDALLSIRSDPEVHESNSSEEEPLSEELWDLAVAALTASDDTLSDEQRLAIGQVANGLAALDVAQPSEPSEDATDDERLAIEQLNAERVARAEARGSVVSVLHALGVTEAEQAPKGRAREIVRERIPTIVEFTDEHRNLAADYDLDEFLGRGDDENPREPPGLPPALANLAALAELDLDALFDAIKSGDAGTVRLLRERANRTLDERFDKDYGQSDACVQFDTDGTVLEVLVRAEGGDDFIPLTERSAGFQWFVALVAFLARRHVERPLVLIDEIERHLHYAAQADLIDVLSRQRLAEQIVYTTHSAGALPPDLGTGVRAVVPVEGRQRSRIDNAFWTSGPGFTPLLFGLGASTLPFAIPRHLLVAEGASEAVLLPTLIRQATGSVQLRYRVAPGIANTPAKDLHRLDEEGGRVGYVVDGDRGGLKHKSRLIAAGIDKGRIVSLDQVTGHPAALEDLLHLDLYFSAVSAELEPYVPPGKGPTVHDVPDFGRAKAIEDWCRGSGIEPPSKVRVAQRVLAMTYDSVFGDESTEQPVLFAPGAQEWLVDLDKRVEKLLRLPRARRA